MSRPSMQDMIKKGFHLDGNSLVKDVPAVTDNNNAGAVPIVPRPVPINQFNSNPKKADWLNNKKLLKHNNKPITYNGIWYQSTKEGKYAMNLDLKVKAAMIKSWTRQIPFDIVVNGIHICKYICDFRVVNNDDSIEFIDIKGNKKGGVYRMFSIKKALVKALHNIDIIEK